MSKDNLWDEILKVGLVLGSIWLGAEYLKGLSDKNGRSHGQAGTEHSDS